jgi:hypothetical protein
MRRNILELNFNEIFQYHCPGKILWWPHIDLVYSKSFELRNMFTDTLNKVTQGVISSTPLRMIQVRVPYFQPGKFCAYKNIISSHWH